MNRHGVPLRTSRDRRVVACVLAAACVFPGPTARGAAAPAPEVAAFEASYAEGEEQFDRGDFRGAAATWSEAARKLPEAPQNRANRVAIHEYIADAYTRALADGDDLAMLRDGLAVLDEYAAAFTAAYPGEALSPKIEAARTNFRGRIAEAEKSAAPTPEREPELAPVPEPGAPAPPPRPWKGLAAAGGVTLGAGVAMLAMFGVGFSRAKSRERAFDDPANACALHMPVGVCQDIYSAGKRAEAVAVAGLVLAPLLIGAGSAMLAVAVRRRAKQASTLSPVFGRGLVGLTWIREF